MTSDLANIKAWWRTLGDDGFLALPPPTRNRYMQSDGHDDAAELIAELNLPTDTSFAYWHWQAHNTAFDRGTTLTAPLALHWGGDHAVVMAGLGAGPEGYEVSDGGQHGAFMLDHVVVRDADGLPDPDDEIAVRQFLAELDEPMHRRTIPYSYRPLTVAEDDWLHARLAETDDIEQRGKFFIALVHHQADRPEDADALRASWREHYASDLTKFVAWQELLTALLRADHPDVRTLVAELGHESSSALAAVPSERSVAELRRLALDGSWSAATHWLEVYAELHEVDLLSAAAVVGTELNSNDPRAKMWSELHPHLKWGLVEGTWSDAERQEVAMVANVRIAVDERLPRQLRSVAARELFRWHATLRDKVATGDPTQQLASNYSLAQLADDLERLDLEELTAGTGPDLTQYTGGLNDTWIDYQELSESDTGWLHAQVADPKTEIQGLGFCLELLYSHGLGTNQDVDALRKRWKSVLAKKYETTYVEWRHPLVTLTCLALDLGHPLAAEMERWWVKPTAKWKSGQRLLTLMGAPTEQKADELWSFVSSGAHDEGQLMTWVLARARLDDRRPVDVADELFATDVRPHVIEKALFGVVDPAQPMWNYTVGDSLGWWHRITQVADDPTLSDNAHDAAIELAGKHWIIAYPQHIRGVVAADMATASQWYDEHR